MRTPTLSLHAARMLRAVRFAASVGVSILVAGIARAQLASGMAGHVPGSSRVIAVRAPPRPSYLVPSADPQFRTRLLRVTNDAGQPTTPVAGTWGPDARHVYSKNQPWNATGTMLTVENRGAGAKPKKLI